MDNFVKRLGQVMDGSAIELKILCSSENYLYAIQLKGTQGAKAWPVLWLVKLELKGRVQLKSRVRICIYV